MAVGKPPSTITNKPLKCLSVVRTHAYTRTRVNRGDRPSVISQSKRKKTLAASIIHRIMLPPNVSQRRKVWIYPNYEGRILTAKFILFFKN